MSSIYSHLSFMVLCYGVLASTAVSRVACAVSTDTANTLEMFQEKILKRRIRTVVFPKKSFLAFTPVFSKAILDGMPRGLLYSMEFDMYNPLPDTVEGWKPTILLNQIEKKKQQTLKETAEVSSNNGNNTDFNFDAVPQYTDEYDHLGLSNSEMYQFPYTNDEDIYSPWAHYHSKIDAGPIHFASQMKNPHIRTSSSAQSHIRQFHRRPFRGNFSKSGTRTDYHQYEAEDYEMDPQHRDAGNNWLHEQNHRERRQIFDQLETIGKLLNFNMKSCIQRAMCEITTQLKPFGESLMDDMIRIILTIPRSSKASSGSANDDYYSHHRYVNVNCAHRFSVSCPYRVLQFLKEGLKLNTS